MKHSKTITRYFAIFTLYFVFVLGAYIFMYLHIFGRSDDIAVAKAEVLALKQENAQIHELAKAAQNTAKERERINSFFIDGERIIEFLETIEGMGETTGVDVEVRSISEKDTSTEKVQGLELTIEFKGDWEKMHHFIVLLESIPIKMTLDRMTLRLQSPQTITEGEAIPAQWTGSVSIRTLQISK